MDIIFIPQGSAKAFRCLEMTLQQGTCMAIHWGSSPYWLHEVYVEELAR